MPLFPVMLACHDTSAGDITASSTDTATTGPTTPRGHWVPVGTGWEVWRGHRTRGQLPPAEPATCAPAGPGWVSGPVAGWARATIVGVFQGNHLGYDLAAVDPDDDGTDALAVGVPTDLLSDYGTGTTYTALAPELAHAPWARAHLMSDLRGVIYPSDNDLLRSENGISDGIGQAIAALTPTGPVLVGDYYGPTGNVVYALRGTTAPFGVTRVEADDGEGCGADIGVADVDGSGTPDIVTACLRSPTLDPGRLRVFESDGSGFRPLASIEGTTPYAWFGSPTVGGFDLDGDGLSELAIGEAHVGTDLASAVYLVSGPWRGSCTLADLDVRTLWTGFSSARLDTGDLDGDGKAELLVSEQGQPPWNLNPDGPPGQVWVLREYPPADGPVGAASWLEVEGIHPEPPGTPATAAHRETRPSPPPGTSSSTVKETSTSST